MATPTGTSLQIENDDDRSALAAKIAGRAPHEAIAALDGEGDETIAQVLEGMNPSDAVSILWEVDDER
ncbi:MAG: hypothetical protein HY271_20325 [Deltaproteobacteria bacterium]|nr:hypothetical protein [Deltaproteobacteria bacterium]